MQKFLHFDWQRVCQLIQTVQKFEFFCVQKDEISAKVEIKNDWQVPWNTGTKTKWRTRLIAENNNVLIQSLKDKAKNTQQRTNNWINVWINRILVGGAC